MSQRKCQTTLWAHLFTFLINLWLTLFGLSSWSVALLFVGHKFKILIWTELISCVSVWVYQNAIGSVLFDIWKREQDYRQMILNCSVFGPRGKDKRLIFMGYWSILSASFSLFVYLSRCGTTLFNRIFRRPIIFNVLSLSSSSSSDYSCSLIVMHSYCM